MREERVSKQNHSAEQSESRDDERLEKGCQEIRMMMSSSRIYRHKSEVRGRGGKREGMIEEMLKGRREDRIT